MSCPAYAAADGIAVWRLEAKSGVLENDIDSISGFITAEVERHSGRKAISEADIHTILKGEEIRQKCSGDGSSECIAEISNALGVPEAVSGDLGRMGDYWILNLRRINVGSAEVIARSGRQIKGDINALIEEIPASVSELFGVSPKPVQNQSKIDKGYKIAGWTLFGAGAGLLALGAVGHVMMNDANGDSKSSFNTWRAVSISGYAVGGSALVAGVSLLIYDAVAGNKNSTDERAFNLGAAPVPGGFAANVQLTW